MGGGLLENYSPPITVDPVDDNAIIAALFAIQQANAIPEYSVQAFLVSATGAVLQDVSPYLVKGSGDEVAWDCTGNVSGSLRITLDASLDLSWGSAILAVYQLIRSVEYNLAQGYAPATYVRFPLGQFVVTSPGLEDLDAADARQVTGFDKNYLLQTEPAVSYAFAQGAQYASSVSGIFGDLGLRSVALSEVADFPGDWQNKLLPGPINHPVGDNDTFLDIVNELCRGSGCRPIYMQPNGRWLVEYTPDPTTQPLRWRWFGSSGSGEGATDLDAKIVLMHKNAYNGDVWNVPNRWIFIQQGLTFQPVEGSGQYTVNNTTLPPSDQVSVGRVITDVQTLQASGQTDLVTQGNAIVTAALSQAEKLSIVTAPWPAARHFDVFQFSHRSLPDSPIRRVQAQKWALPLWGDPMTWSTNVVAAL